MVVGVGRLECGEGVPQKALSWRTLSACALWALSSSIPTPAAVPFYYSNWEQNIWTQHCFRACSCILPASPPLLFAEPSLSLWDLVKTKSHCRGGSGLAQPTGRTQSHKCEGLLYSVPLCFLESHGNLTLPVLIALKTLKKCP